MIKIGFISRAFPEDPETSVSGMYKRMGMFIQAMKEMGELDMLFYVRPDLDVNRGFIAEMEERLAKRWDAQLRLDLCNLVPERPTKGRWQEYISPALNIANHPPYMYTTQSKQINAVQQMLSRKPDILFAHRLTGMIPVLLSHGHHPRIYFDLDDIEHLAFIRSIKQPPWWPGKWLNYLRLPILMLWERRAVRFSHTTFVCSETDRQYLSKVYCMKNVMVIPNAIDIPEKQEIPDKPTLLFLGNMSYLPNTVGADYLISKIWPIISSAVPEAKLLIAGSNPDNIASFEVSPPGVEFLGFVDDLDKLYKEVRVVCCPIFSGGGTRIKILEAAAYGKPVVSTTIGAEGIDMQDGEEILLRDDPKNFAGACIRLLNDKNYAEKIGQTARSFVDRDYDKMNVIHRIKMHLNHHDGMETF
jgi:glycosyltransferase involved in cell wall biosynthesis